MLFTLSFVVILYALYQYHTHGRTILSKAPGGYHDMVGPFVLVLFFVAIIADLSVAVQEAESSMPLLVAVSAYVLPASTAGPNASLPNQRVVTVLGDAINTPGHWLVVSTDHIDVVDATSVAITRLIPTPGLLGSGEWASAALRPVRDGTSHLLAASPVSIYILELTSGRVMGNIIGHVSVVPDLLAPGEAPNIGCRQSCSGCGIHARFHASLRLPRNCHECSTENVASEYAVLRRTSR